MWVALMVMLGLGYAVLRIVPPATTNQRRMAEEAFWNSTTWLERVRLGALAKRLPGEAVSLASLELRRLVSASRSEFIRPKRVRVTSQGPRDLCLIDLPDGSTLRLTVFDSRNANRFASIWSPDADLGLRLRFVEGLGWQCSLRTDVGLRGAVVASVYGWLAEIDRSHQGATR